MVFRFHLFKEGLPLMNRALDAYALRQQTISKNMANATSPHYRPERVKFEEFFHKQQIVIGGSREFSKDIPMGNAHGDVKEGEKEPKPIPEPEIFFEGETHVNIDHEMSQLAQNQIRFKFGSQMANRFFTGISSSISGVLR
jgi:flagellar basal-body rod protein FlgB